MSLPNNEWDLGCQGGFVIAHEIPVANVAVCDRGMHVDDEGDHKRAQVIDPWQARERRGESGPAAVRWSDLVRGRNHSLSDKIIGR